MKRTLLNPLPLSPRRPAGWVRLLQWMLFALFAVQLAVVGCRVLWPSALFGGARWPDGVLVVLATAVTVATMARELPAQNVLLASITIAFIGGAVQTLGVLTSIPFGPFKYTARIGQELFPPLPWAVPALWVVAALNSGGVARLILRPYRQIPNYGFWRIGVTALLMVLFDLALEPFATVVQGYWVWQPTKLPFDWHGMPWVNSLGWALTALVMLAFVTPALINKNPVKLPSDYCPLAVWLLLNGLFLAGAASHRLWPATGLISVQCVAVGGLALWGGMKREG